MQDSIEKLSDDELREKTNELKQRLQVKKEDLNGPILEEAFAVSGLVLFYKHLRTRGLDPSYAMERLIL